MIMLRLYSTEVVYTVRPIKLVDVPRSSCFFREDAFYAVRAARTATRRRSRDCRDIIHAIAAQASRPSAQAGRKKQSASSQTCAVPWCILYLVGCGCMRHLSSYVCFRSAARSRAAAISYAHNLLDIRRRGNGESCRNIGGNLLLPVPCSS